ncbi:MAG: hypothetical protein AB1430_03205 [Pseudomonadota bacterium]
MDLKVPITIIDELSESIVRAKGLLDLASGEIRRVEYEDYDVEKLGLPVHDETYEFTVGSLSNAGKDVEFKIDVDMITGKYSVSASELLEIKVRAAKLFAGIDGKDMLRQAEAKTTADTGPKRGVTGGRHFH